MFLGIDLGTSSIKIVIMDSAGKIMDSASSEFSVSRPQPLWSEQNPADWWQGLEACMAQLSSRQSLGAILSIGLSGQMHGATLLDKDNNIIRPAILWNDGRCEAECKEIELAEPRARDITGNIVMPGFTAPKVLWVKNHEPSNFTKIHKVLLPKDYLRFLLTGDYASDMSDSAGTSWLDVAKRNWSEDMLATTGLTKSHMPKLYEGSDVTGTLSQELAFKWGMQAVPVVAGAGDNAAGAIGLGIVSSGQAMISLGTSGVYFAAADGFHMNADSAVHSFCHALPNAWHLMSVNLSAASCLQWFADNIAKREVTDLLAELEHPSFEPSHSCLFLPYLAGERTPHNNPNAQGVFFGLTGAVTQAQMTYAILEGVAFSLADSADALHSTGLVPEDITLIGGGAKSPLWRQMIANVLGRPLSFRAGGEVGPALGAARLAQLAIETNKSLTDVCPVPEIVAMHQPDREAHAQYLARRTKFKHLYEALEPLF